jgi:hypothetical protein
MIMQVINKIKNPLVQQGVNKPPIFKVQNPDKMVIKNYVSLAGLAAALQISPTFAKKQATGSLWSKSGTKYTFPAVGKKFIVNYLFLEFSFVNPCPA